MGELFRRSRPETSIAWTGERLVPTVGGAIEGEHLHRYFLARDLCRGKRVLDIASGEGYGSALLAQTALDVTGVEVEEAAVQHATKAYRASNLRYVQGDASRIPLADGSVDVVVCFETLEHLRAQDRFFAEVQRVLQPDGLLILSTPDTTVYSASHAVPNPFHVRELTRQELAGYLGTTFRKFAVLQQRFVTGSAILPEDVSATCNRLIYEQRDADTFELHHHLARAPFLVSLATNGELPSIQTSLYLQTPVQTKEAPGLTDELQEELKRLRAVEAEAETAQAELTLLRPKATRAQEELRRAEEEALRFRQAKEAIDGERHRLDGETRRLQEVVRTQQAEIARLQRFESDVQAIRERASQVDSLLQSRDELRERVAVLQRQLESSVLLAQQQGLVVRRLQLTFGAQTKALLKAREAEEKQSEISRMARAEHATALNRYRTANAELASVREQLEQQKAMTNKIAGMIVPVWMRKLIPNSLRHTARALKRDAGSQVQS